MLWLTRKISNPLSGPGPAQPISGAGFFAVRCLSNGTDQPYLQSACINGAYLAISHFINSALSIMALSILLASGGCSMAPSLERRPASAEGLKAAARLSPEQATDITIYALGLVGTPYRYGGNTPDSGFDCSGLIGYVYQTRAGMTSPRTVAKLQAWGQPVSAANVRSGDLVLFAERDVVTHAGIYVGRGRFVHAPSAGGEVRLDYLNSRYWASQQVAFRRP